ncbi:hypothetical protein ACFQ0B_35040 [Nonomuraea thailandensis]
MPSQEHPPGLNPVGKDDGVAVVFPAHSRPQCVEDEVESLLATLAEAGLEHRIVIVGQPGGVPGALDVLASRYPDRVLTVPHEGEPDAARAERAGVLAALERTDMRRLVLVGPGDRINAADLPVLLRVQREERADAVVGTPERARSRTRRATVLTWAAWDRLLPRGQARGGACSYRLLDRWLLEEWGHGGRRGRRPWRRRGATCGSSSSRCPGGAVLRRPAPSRAPGPASASARAARPGGRRVTRCSPW